MGYVWAPRFRKLKQWGRYNSKLFMLIHRTRQQRKYAPQIPAPVFEERGIKLEDPNDPDFPRKTSQEPIEVNHPAWPKPTHPTMHPLYKERPCFMYTGSDPLAESVNHALAISKAVLRAGLPASFLGTADWIDLTETQTRLEQLIMHSQRYDSEVKRLPKRRDPIIWWYNFTPTYGITPHRKNELLLDNLFRFAQVESARNLSKDVALRRFVRTAPFNVTLERHDNLVGLNLTSHLTVCQPHPLESLADANVVEATRDEKLADIHPITPTVDLQQEYIYDTQVLTPFSWSATNRIHTVFINKVNHNEYPWAPSELTAHATMAAFTAALSSAKAIFPNEKGRLPEPVVAQCVQCCGGVFEFVVFQLNTVDFVNDEGIKNIAYVDGENKFFATQEPWKDFEGVKDYDPTVLRKFIAIMSNGVRAK